MGELPSYDAYYVARSAEVHAGFEDPGDMDAGQRDVAQFLRNLLYVNTFITRAELDGAIVADAIPELLAHRAATIDPPLASNVAVDLEAREGVARPGWITVAYEHGGDEDEAGTTRTIRFPSYPNAGHMVSLSSPAALFEDVRDFLEETGD